MKNTMFKLWLMDLIDMGEPTNLNEVSFDLWSYVVGLVNEPCYSCEIC